MASYLVVRARATIATLTTILEIVLAVLIAMAVMTSQLWGDWRYIVSSLAAQVEVHRRATIVLPALLRAGDQRLASDQRAMDASILALIRRHRDIE